MHVDGWPVALERAWQRVVGRSLDAHGVPGVLGDELAASFLLRAGERERAESSVRRHLSYHPRDARGWGILAEFEPVRAAARCAFHGGPILDAAGDLLDAVAEDELGAGSKGVVAARKRLQRISPVAYERYLARAARAG